MTAEERQMPHKLFVKTRLPTTSYLHPAAETGTLPPSPQPSPAGRGSHAVRVSAKGGVRVHEQARSHSLSQREMARVRENGPGV